MPDGRWSFARARSATRWLVAGSRRRPRRSDCRHRPPTAQPAQHILERDGAIEQREAHEQRLEEQLLLAALPEARLELADACSMRSRSPAANAIARSTQRLAQPARETSVGRAAEHDGELRAQHVGEAGEEDAEVDARVGEPRDRGEHVAGATLGDEVEQREELVLRHEAERVAHALRGHRAVAHREHLVGED